MKIGFLYQWKPSNARALEHELDYMRGKRIPIFGVNLNSLISYKMSVSGLDFQYCLKNPIVIDGLQKVAEACSDFSVIIVYGTLQLPPDFIRRNFSDKFVIYWATDDPVNSTVATLPYLGVADHVFSQTPRYIDSISMPTWLTQMGAKAASYVPLGYFQDWMRGLSSDEILSHTRDIEISFVGSPSWRKEMLLDAKRIYGRRLQIFSRDWPFWRHFAYDAVKKGVFHIVRNAPDESSIYFRSKISINSNACSGSSTSRTFHIPICGALQLCDFADGLQDIFDVGTQVMAYDFISAESLCKVIEAALSSESKLAERQREGFWHVHDHYRFGDILGSKLAELL